jgi:hypothetical protein
MTCHKKNEKEGEFESLKSESLCFKRGTPIMFGPSCTFSNDIRVLEVLFGSLTSPLLLFRMF